MTESHANGTSDVSCSRQFSSMYQLCTAEVTSTAMCSSQWLYKNTAGRLLDCMLSCSQYLSYTPLTRIPLPCYLIFGFVLFIFAYKKCKSTAFEIFSNSCDIVFELLGAALSIVALPFSVVALVVSALDVFCGILLLKSN